VFLFYLSYTKYCALYMLAIICLSVCLCADYLEFNGFEYN